MGPFISARAEHRSMFPCHVILNEEDIQLPEKPDEAEMDMLDLAEGLTPTSSSVVS